MRSTVISGLIAFVMLLSYGCVAPGIIPVYSAGKDQNVAKKNAAVLYAENSIKIFSIDGNNTLCYPAFSPNAYGGSHIYLEPGVHYFKFRFWTDMGLRRLSVAKPVTIRHHFKIGRYYELKAIYDKVAAIANNGNWQRIDFAILDNGDIPEDLPKTLKEKRSNSMWHKKDPVLDELLENSKRERESADSYK